MPAWILCVICLGVLGGCLGASQDYAKKTPISAETASLNRRATSSAASTEITLTARPDTSTSVHKSTGKTGSADAAGSKTSTHPKTEAEQAKALALDLADKGSNVNKIKICHDKKHGEWWFTLYEDTGLFLDLKQYIWKVDQETPEPFLVMKRISKDNLPAELKQSAQDKTCSVLDFAKKPKRSNFAEALLGPEAHVKKAPPVESTRKIAARIEKPQPQRTSPPKAKRPPQESALTHTKAQERAATPVTEKDPTSSPAKQLIAKRPVKPKPTRKEKPRKETPKTNSPGALVAVPASAPADGSDSGPLFSVRAGTIQSGLSAKSDQEEIPLPKKPVRLSRAAVEPTPPTEEAVTAVTAAPHEEQRQSYNVFVYGTEMNHQDLLRWLKLNNFETSLIADAAPALLENYDYVWNYYSSSRGGGAVNLEEHEHARVYGVLLEVKGPALKALDKRAGHPYYYSRGDEELPVKRLDNGEIIYAWVYTAKPNRDGRKDVWPTEDYKQKIMEAALFWQFPTEQLGKIYSWRTNED